MTGCLIIALGVAALAGVIITPSMLAPLGIVVACCLLWDFGGWLQKRQ